MMRLTPQDQTAIVPHSSGGGAAPAGRPAAASAITASPAVVARSGWMSAYPTVAYPQPRARISSASAGSACALNAGPLVAVPGGGGGPPPKFTSRMTGTDFWAFAGVVSTTVMRGPSALEPTAPTTFFRVAAPSRAFGSVSATCHVTFGAVGGMRP